MVKADFVDKINNLNKLKSQLSLKKVSEIPGVQQKLSVETQRQRLEDMSLLADRAHVKTDSGMFKQEPQHYQRRVLNKTLAPGWNQGSRNGTGGSKSTANVPELALKTIQALKASETSRL